MKLVRLIKMCLNETYCKVRIGKHLSDNFLIQNGLKQGDALSPLLFNFALEYVIRKTRWDWKKNTQILIDASKKENA
jgi:hypothetical protein